MKRGARARRAACRWARGAVRVKAEGQRNPPRSGSRDARGASHLATSRVAQALKALELSINFGQGKWR
jgi:hypothetical protein